MSRSQHAYFAAARSRLARLCLAIALGALALPAASCGDDGGSFTVTRESGESVVEGQSSPLDDVLPTRVIPSMRLEFDLQSELEERDAGAAKAVFVESIELVVTDSRKEGPEDVDNFDFLDNIEVYIASRKDDTSLEERRIAVRDPVPEGRTSFQLDVESDIDIKPYVEEGVRLTTRGSGELPEDDVSIKAVVTLRIRVL